MHSIQERERSIRLFRLAVLGAAAFAALLVVVVLGAGLGGGAQRNQSADAERPNPASSQPTRHTIWIISGEDLASLRHDNAGLARRFFDNRDTFVVGSPTGEQDLVPTGYRSIPTLGYTSLRAFEHDLHSGKVDTRIVAALYNPERWSRTPAGERRAPVAAMHQFSQLASRWGYGSIVAPGRDLALETDSGCSKRSGEYLDQAYLRCGLIAGAEGAESFVVQTAPEELDLDRLRRLLHASKGQLAKFAPDTRGLASISTAPPDAGEAVWPIDLLRATHLELNHAAGVMLNFNPATTALAASFLRDLEREGAVNRVLVSGRD